MITHFFVRALRILWVNTRSYIGAALRVKDDMWYAEGQVDIARAISTNFTKKTGLDLLAGFDHRTYIIHPDGNYFINYVPGKEYRAWTNSKSEVHNIGWSLGLSYKMFRNYTLSGNVSYAKLQRTNHDDALEDGFNTPKWITNASFGGNHLIGNLGFNATYKWQSSFYWQSFLVNGQVNHYGTIDAQANYDFLNGMLNLKLGATNLTNKYYNSFLGGPSVGGFYYSTLTLALK